VDLATVRQHPEWIATMLVHQRIRTTPVPGGDTANAQRLTLDDGTDLFAKTTEGAPPGLCAAEAEGLRWLAEPGVVPVPAVLAVTDELLILEWIPPGPATPAAAEQLGRGLAALHRAGAGSYGAPRPGWIGSLPLDNTTETDWPTFYARRRLAPFLRLAADRGALDSAGARVLDAVLGRVNELAGPAEPPARLHGDLWGGNLLWSAHGTTGTAWLVDPAAYGGHRETDLAMLRLFGAPHLDRILDAYAEAAPLADGWADRVPLYQLYPLLVHAALFGGSYGQRAANLARRLLAG
jgi:fructosamine-3-kinase